MAHIHLICFIKQTLLLCVSSIKDHRSRQNVVYLYEHLWHNRLHLHMPVICYCHILASSTSANRYSLYLHSVVPQTFTDVSPDLYSFLRNVTKTFQMLFLRYKLVMITATTCLQIKSLEISTRIKLRRTLTTLEPSLKTCRKTSLANRKGKNYWLVLSSSALPKVFQRWAFLFFCNVHLLLLLFFFCKFIVLCIFDLHVWF